ncbi:MAG: P-II family nitrogen regulator [Clostridia bacterium]|nr:P-II family nitrogen regulator [Clostridia bacterium]
MNYVFSIVNPGMSARMNDICEKLELPLRIELIGRGTATKNMLDLLGLSAREYHIIMTVADRERTAALIDEARRQLYIDAPGHGIIAATPIKSVGGGKTLSHLNGGKPTEGAPEINYNYEIILAIANEGYTDAVMDAAREAGARGGTVLHGKGTGSTDAAKFFGVSIATEKEVIMIVARSSEKAAIMKSIINKAGNGTDAGAVVMSLPVSAVAGFGLLDNLETNE